MRLGKAFGLYHSQRYSLRAVSCRCDMSVFAQVVAEIDEKIGGFRNVGGPDGSLDYFDV